ncbi:MAG: CHAT domain-containing protein [Phycisphaeraceae bacterium]|nr:CHAT domain-containing protein [Phycisphaerales bacterium]MCB9843667.1 CHAT domain-containing protein [Phycisphaeraceae bacterium]
MQFRTLRSVLLAIFIFFVPAIPAPAQDTLSEEPFHLDLPEWNPAPEDLPPELRPLDIVRPTLPDEVAGDFASLQSRISELTHLGLSAERKEEQDAALEEAIELSKQVLAIRIKYQGNTDEFVRWRDINGEPSEWWEIANIRAELHDFMIFRDLTLSDRADVLDAMQLLDQERQYLEQSKFDEAISLVDSRLSTFRRILGDTHGYTTANFNRRANYLRMTGRLSEARQQFEELLKYSRESLGSDHPHLAIALNNLATVSQALGDTSTALRLRTEAIVVMRRVFSDNHVNTMAMLNNYGYSLQARGRLREAEPFYRIAYDLRLETLGPMHPHTLESILNLGFLYQAQGRLDVAEHCFRAVHESSQEVLGPSHTLTLLSISNLGYILDAQGRTSESDWYVHRAYNDMSDYLGPNHPHTLQAQYNLGYSLLSQGHIDRAATHLSNALERQSRVLGAEHPTLSDTLSALGWLERVRHNFDEAERLYRDAHTRNLRAYGNRHPSTLLTARNLAGLLMALGRNDEAEPLLVSAVNLAPDLLGQEHPRSIDLSSTLASLYAIQGQYQQSELLYSGLFDTSDLLRTSVTGDATSRAQFADKLNLDSVASGYSITLAHLSRPSEALTVLERGRSRAALDMFAGGRGAAERVLRASGSPEQLTRYDSALDAEQSASEWVFESEARMAAAPDEDKEHWREEIKKARMMLSEKTAAVFTELRGLVPAADPMSAEQILDAMRPDEALLTFAFTDYGSVALVARGGDSNEVFGHILADNKDAQSTLTESLATLRAAVSSRASTDRSPDTAIAAARSALLPSELLEQLKGVKSLTVVADGPLTGIPMELLIDDIPIAYAPSATIAMKQRNRPSDAETGLASAVIVGDPVFAGASEEPDYPESGLLLAMVVDDSNAAIAGMRRGDVLVSYGQHAVASMDDLRAAVGAVNEELATRGGVDPAARTVSAELWRDGEIVEVALAPGSMGVQLDQRPPAEGLRSMKFFDRSWDQQAADASALEQVRLYGGALSPLPATRLEAQSVASMFGDGSTLLVGSDANAPMLRSAVTSHPPRVLHLATHGLLGSSARPLLASLALSTPDEPSIDNTGFLTLEEVLNEWGGSLQGTELVVLSACDTADGIQQGDTAMTLPLGFFVCGADTVIASLWKVDDRATALLMARFYANWLGKAESQREIDGVQYDAHQPMPKLAALREARQWLRSLTQDQVDAIFASDASVAEAASRGPSPRRGELAPSDNNTRLYDHPYYYSAFILQGKVN